MNLNQDYCNAGKEPVLVTIPFALFLARDIAGNPAGGLVLDKGAITSVGLWVNAIAGSDAIDENGMVNGTIYYDGITAVKSGKTKAEVKKVSQKPVEPSRPNVSAQPSSTGETTQTVVRNVVQPSYVNADGVRVTGWQAVIDAAYQNAQLREQEVPLASTPDAVQNRLTVDISLEGVTELVIPQATVLKMQQTQADYNFYYQGIVLTVSADTIAACDGDMDLKVFIQRTPDFGAGFDALYLKKRNTAVLDQAVTNVVLSADKAGNIAYIFGKDAQSGYQLLYTEQISELGTAVISADSNEEYLILY